NSRRRPVAPVARALRTRAAGSFLRTPRRRFATPLRRASPRRRRRRIETPRLLVGQSPSSRSSSGRGSWSRSGTRPRLSNTTAHSCRDGALTPGPLLRGMPGHPAYPDKGIMRVHASLRDDIRLWGSAVAGALVLFTVIVVLGIGPSRFPSFGTGHPRASRTVVVPQDGSTVTPAHRPTSSSSANHAAQPKYNVPATGNNAAVAQPRSGPSAQRPTPSPVK